MWRAAANKKAMLHGRARLLFALAILSLAVLTVTACSSVAPVVKVGLVGPFEGRNRAIGYDVLYSARLAVREINASGGIGGTRIALVALDDGGSPEFAAATADSLLLDPNVVAVVGHWMPETTAVARPRYDEGALAFLAGGEAPFAAVDPASLSPDFVTAYTAVTPFDEVPGPYAGPAYDAFQMLWQVLAESQEKAGIIDRTAVNLALKSGSIMQ